MGDEGWGGGGALFFSTDPKCLCFVGSNTGAQKCLERISVDDRCRQACLNLV